MDMSDPQSVHPYEPVGAWDVPHTGHRRAAARLLNHVRTRAAALTALQVGYEAEHGPSTYDWRQHSDEIHLLEDMALAAELYCYMAVEGFLNHYGVARLGAEFFKANLERLGPEKKAAVILVATEQVVLPPAHDLPRLLRQMFERRNQLVHPKSKQLESVRLQLFAPDSLCRDANAVFDQMRRFFEAFGAFHTTGFLLE